MLQVAILNNLLELGSDYRTVQRFISSGGGGGGGMYLESVCRGLDLVLDSYRGTLTLLEKEMMCEGDSFPLSLVQHRLSPHRHVLRHLVRLVTELTRESRDQRSGVMILDTVYKAASSGLTEVGVAMRRILAEGHKVLFKQLLAWLLQGALYDPHQEFFIVTREGEESLLVGEEPGDSVARSKSGQYRLDYDMVPGHISHKLAEKIFFIGESIQMFESDKRVDVQGEVLRQREAELYRDLARLRDQDELVITEFGRIVERLRESVSAHLYQLVVAECGLETELGHVWEVFTLARGEIFHAFIQLADRRLSSPPGPATQHDTNLAWHNAILAHSDTEADALMTRASLIVSRDGAHAPGWDQLSVQYAVPWPLHLIITPQVHPPCSVHCRCNVLTSYISGHRKIQLDIQIPAPGAKDPVRPALALVRQHVQQQEGEEKGREGRDDRRGGGGQRGHGHSDPDPPAHDLPGGQPPILPHG